MTAHIGGAIFASGRHLKGPAVASHQLVGDITLCVTATPSSLPANDSADWIMMQTAIGEPSNTNALYALGIRNNGGTCYWSYFHEAGNGDNYRVDTDFVVGGVGVTETLEFSRDTTAKNLEVIINGDTEDERVFSYSTNPTGGELSWLYIARSTSSSQYFNGVISHAGIWSAKRAATDKGKYNDVITNGLPTLSAFVDGIDAPNLVSYYPIAGQSTEVDFGPAAVDLTAQNGLPVPDPYNVTFTSPNLYPSWQGYTPDGTHHYTSHNTALHKYADDASWTEVAENNSPFAGLPGTPDHISDPCNDGTYLFGFVHNVGADPDTDKALVRWLLSDLSVDSYTVLSDSAKGSAIDIDDQSGNLYVPHFSDNVIDIYSTSFVHQGTVTLSLDITGINGFAIKNGFMYLVTASGFLYIADMAGKVRMIHDMPGSYLEYQGMDYSSDTLRFLVIESYAIDGNNRVRFIDNVPAANDPALTGPEIVLGAFAA